MAVDSWGGVGSVERGHEEGGAQISTADVATSGIISTVLAKFMPREPAG